MNQKLKAAVYGLAVADALGVPYEFQARGSFEATGMTGYGSHNQPAGTWSDDTSMVLACCASIKESGRLDLADMRRKFRAWLFEGAYTADGLTFDVGRTSQEALSSGRGLDGVYDNGNGSLMRILPLAFTEAGPAEIAAVSAITHAHALSIEACQLYVTIARQLLAGQELALILANLTVSPSYGRLKELDQLPESAIGSSGYVVDSLEAALWCLLKTSSYPQAVLRAVNLGEDTDTVASVTGGLAGIIYGLEGIPADWLDQLRNRELLEACLF